MKRKAVVRHLTLGALATGLVPLTAAGAGAGPGADSAAALCRSTFGDQGPTGGRIVGEGPSGDPMVVSIGWDPGDWPGDQLGAIVTCVSAGDRPVPSLTTFTESPPNSGSLILSLTLPAGEPGSLVCEQSVLVGKGAADGQNRPTSPVCFKLRGSAAPEPTPPGGSAPAGPPAPVPGAKHASSGPPAPKPAPPDPGRGAVKLPAPSTPDPASTPPARAAFEAASSPRGPGGPYAARTAAAPVTKAGPVAAAPAASSTPPAAPAGAPATALARTGFEHHIPLAGAGGLLALGGAAILFGEPRRRSGSRSWA
jgi:hypothetical protein